MAIVLRSPLRVWVSVVTIVGAMLAAADASAHDTTGKHASTGVSTTNCSCFGSAGPSDNSAARDQDRLVVVNQLAAPGAAQDGSKTNDGPGVSCSEPPVNPACRTSHRTSKTHAVRAARTIRVVFDLGVRLKRVQGGSTLCWLEHFPGYCVTMPVDDPNDDATSDDPDDDDNDTSKFLNGDDETEVAFTAWLPERAPYLIVPECTLLTRTARLSSTLLHNLQRLRC